MCYIKGFIRYKNTAFSLNYSTDISLRCCKVSRVLQLCSTAFLIIEISEFNRLIARLLSFKAYESCQGLDMVNYILQPHWRRARTHTHRLLNGHTPNLLRHQLNLYLSSCLGNRPVWKEDKIQETLLVRNGKEIRIFRFPGHPQRETMQSIGQYSV